MSNTVNSFGPNARPLWLSSGAPRLITVTTELERDTLHDVATSLAGVGIRHERWTYHQLFSKWRLPRAVYILTDFDRLHPWQIEVAARFRHRLLDQGLTVLNDPRRFVPRASFLKRLYLEGINQFDCWLPAQGEMPERYPVFLRTIHAHRGVESDVLANEAEAMAALEAALADGRVICDLVFVEYAAQADPETGKFRKHACYGINGKMIRALTVTEHNWVAKAGSVGAASEVNYQQDLAEHTQYPQTELMKHVFELSGVEFGRVDYGMVDGKPQIYELNSNPTIRWIKSHPSPTRIKADKVIQNDILTSIQGLPFPTRGKKVNVFGLVPRFGAPATTYGQS